MDYQLVGQPTGELLVKVVNELIVDGWKPQGGIAVIQIPRSQQDYGGATMTYFQAMVRESAA